MTLLREVRQSKLSSLRDHTKKAISQSKLYYKTSSSQYPVYQIDLDLLIYNRHNGRLESEMLTWQQEYSVGDDEYNDELHERIDKFLWQANTVRNRLTLIDLEKKGQQRPGIVTLDGVIIDGNRRAMLLRRIEDKTNQKQFLEAVILPDSYDEDEKEIVRLETQYQLGEDAILDYGPLEKYLHAKRLHDSLGIETAEIAQLMGEKESRIKDLLKTMSLMDEYLEHIGCEGLYNMLKEDGGGTKEGMFVDLNSDMKRLDGGGAQIQWPYDPEVDLLELKTIQFDYIRSGSGFTGTNKTYRAISHEGSGKKSFFAFEDIWAPFTERHRSNVNDVSKEMGTLDDYVSQNPDLAGRVDSAKARDSEWENRVSSAMKENFGISEDVLESKVGEQEPSRLLQRALNLLKRVDFEKAGFAEDSINRDRVLEISNLTFQMKKMIERHEKKIIST